MLTAVSAVSITEEFWEESLNDEDDHDNGDKSNVSVFSVSVALLPSLTVDALPQLI